MSDINSDNKLLCSDEATDNYIELEWSKNVCWINNMYVDPDNVKLFFLLIKTSLAKMEKKGCEKYQQLVSVDDWNLFLKENKEWRILSENTENNSLLIECDIKYSHELLIDSLLRNNNCQ